MSGMTRESHPEMNGRKRSQKHCPTVRLDPKLFAEIFRFMFFLFFPDSTFMCTYITIFLRRKNNIMAEEMKKTDNEELEKVDGGAFAA